MQTLPPGWKEAGVQPWQPTSAPMPRRGMQRKTAAKSAEPSPPLQRTGMALHAQLSKLIIEDTAGIEAPGGVVKTLEQLRGDLSQADTPHSPLHHLPMVDNLDNFLAAGEFSSGEFSSVIREETAEFSSVNIH